MSLNILSDFAEKKFGLRSHKAGMDEFLNRHVNVVTMNPHVRDSLGLINKKNQRLREEIANRFVRRHQVPGMSRRHADGLSNDLYSGRDS